MEIRHAVEVVGLAVDAVGVAVIVVATGIAGFSFARGLNRGLPFGDRRRLTSGGEWRAT